MNSKPKVIIITGPTATGKSHLGALLGNAANGEVVSADSIQIYRHMDIGSAKPAADEMMGIPHHMLSIIPPWEDYSAARYVQDAAKCVDDILARGKLPIIVGGTGLYIDSLISGRVFSDRADNSLRAEIEAQYDELGADAMRQILSTFDPVSAQKIHHNNKRRIVRAIEVYRTTGKTISQHDADTKAIPPRYDAVKIALTFSNRADLYARIDRRVDLMFDAGLVQEVQSLLEMGVTSRATSLQAIGYKEVVDALSGNCSIDDAIEKIKMESRRYAKRQLTWLRRDLNAKWITWEKTPDFDLGLSVSTEYL